MEEKEITPQDSMEEHTPTNSEDENRTPSKDLLDRTWDFFASVPVATVIIFVIAAASIAGTLIEQEGQYASWKPPAEFYPERYGAVMGVFLMKTGMTRTYSSWWYLTLCFMLGASLVICSLERFIPLWRAVQRPNPAPEKGFVTRLKQRFTFAPAAVGAPYTELAAALKAKRYLVIEQDGRLYADKGRWGRWGPYVTHVGLILIIVGALMRAIPGFYMDQFIWVKDGEIVKVPNADFYIQSEKFEAEFYDTGAPKSYRTHAVILDGEGNRIKQATIIMNEPLGYRWIEFYQQSYQTEAGLALVSLRDRTTNAELGQFQVDLTQPDSTYTVGGYKLRVVEYFTDFGLDQNSQPISRSSKINNPGLMLEITTPEGQAFTSWFFVMYPEMEFDATVPVKFQTLDIGAVSTTGLKVKKDLGIPVIYLGLLVVTLGVFATFYIAHRRYWALVEGDRVVVGGWTNRNHGSLVQEMQQIGYQLDPEANPIAESLEGEER